ncbi:PDR/VanB family oxidoreductase [Nocardia nova]|uniref:Oxidoreductase n=1 Tax=Nocardia nova TaxID=37330 RepID=A0A2S6A1Z1_9NOCA|nr:PDR/VanB family oxidoreductase [Nocardia nova]PPJ25577.1 oxidoreductase [Nocardia nova]
MTDDSIFELEISRRQREADGVISLELRDPQGRPLPEWRPGAHIDLLLPTGAERQYSLCGGDSTWTVAILDAPNSRGGSSWIHQHLHAGSRVAVRGPRNRFPLIEAQRYIFLAGGIGITPIVAMIRHLERVGIADWKLVYGGRSRTSMAFLDELTELGDRVEIIPADEQGMIDVTGALGPVQFGTTVYCCGPEPLLNSVERACRSWPPDTLHVERFAPAVIDESGDQPFEVVAERSGLTVTVEPGTSILDALADQGIYVTSSCGEGVCGTCETKVLAGEVDHRDAILTEQERESHAAMMVCCSRARGARLVLDV